MYSKTINAIWTCIQLIIAEEFQLSYKLSQQYRYVYFYHTSIVLFWSKKPCQS